MKRAICTLVRDHCRPGFSPRNWRDKYYFISCFKRVSPTIGLHGPGQLYAIQEVVAKIAQQYPVLPVNARHYQQWTRSCAGCRQMALLRPDEVSLTGEGDPERIGAVKMSASLLPPTGVVPCEEGS